MTLNQYYGIYYAGIALGKAVQGGGWLARPNSKWRGLLGRAATISHDEPIFGSSNRRPKRQSIQYLGTCPVGKIYFIGWVNGRSSALLEAG